MLSAARVLQLYFIFWLVFFFFFLVSNSVSDCRSQILSIFATFYSSFPASHTHCLPHSFFPAFLVCLSIFLSFSFLLSPTPGLYQLSPLSKHSPSFSLPLSIYLSIYLFICRLILLLAFIDPFFYKSVYLVLIKLTLT